MYTVDLAFDFQVGIDPYRQSTGGQTTPSACLVVNQKTDTIRVCVSQDNPGETGIWTDEYLYVPLQYGADASDYGDDGWTPKPAAFESLMRSDQANALLQRIAQGYSTDWRDPKRPGDGYLVYCLDEDAQAALDELDDLILELPADNTVGWNIGDWFGDTDWKTIDAAEVDEFIAEPCDPEGDARLTEDPTDYILERFFDSLQDELYMKRYPSDLLHHRGAAILVQRDDDGDIEQVEEIVTPAGNRWGAPDPDDLITQTEAAQIANLTPQAVNNAIRERRLHAYSKPDAVAHRPGDRMVSRAEVEKLWSPREA
jgi:hypothetical protein